MYKLGATLLKDLRILTRDKVGLLCMFAMPIILAIVITALQNSTFELVNDNKVSLLLCNKDTGVISKELVTAIDKAGLFNLKQVVANESRKAIEAQMHDKDALIAIIIPAGFSAQMKQKTEQVAGKALVEFGMEADTLKKNVLVESVELLYHPVLQESFRQSIKGALRSTLQIVESKQVLKSIYFALNEKELPPALENDILNNQVEIRESAVLLGESRQVPNATQHNIPAWTIFAMFFIVISLGSSVVKEKQNGSFLRLKTLPTNYLLSLFSKQLTYLLVTLLQAAVIFSIGRWIFPHVGLPALNMPTDLGALLLVSIMCGWCAVSFAICLGVFAQTQEQVNGIGAVAIVLMAALGGLLVPSFAMPASFQTVLLLSPLHWCLEAFYGLFLEGGKLKDVLINILPLFAITVCLHLAAWVGLKRKKLI